jgi:hypothetical protein
MDHILILPFLNIGDFMLKKLLRLMSILLLCSISSYALPLLPGGHVRLGYGIQGSNDQQSVDLKAMQRFQLSVDTQPTLLPIYFGLDMSSDFGASSGSVSLPSGAGSIESSLQEFTLNLKWYQELALLDIYAGAGLTYAKTEQEIRTVTLIQDIVSDGLGTTFILGVTDIEMGLPMVEWGLEFRYTRVDFDAIADVEPKAGTWLLTMGYGW